MDDVMHHRTGIVGRTLLAIAGCAVIALWATSAQASCGDWLAGHDMTAGGMHHADPSLDPSEHAPAAERPTGRRGCRGPSCSKAPVVPLAPSGDSTLEPAAGRWACLAASRVDLVLRRDRTDGHGALFVPTGPCGRIDRPPRIG